MNTIDDQTVVATYRTHQDAEAAVRELEKAGVPMKQVSIIGRDWQIREDIQGYYHPGDAVREGAGTGACFGGLFGLFMGFGLFLIPVAGTLIVLGPLAGLIAGTVGGAGVGALVGGLMSLGIPKDQALKYQTRLEAGQFLVVVHGTMADISRAQEILQRTDTTDLQRHAPLAAAVA